MPKKSATKIKKKMQLSFFAKHKHVLTILAILILSLVVISQLMTLYKQNEQIKSVQKPETKVLPPEIKVKLTQTPMESTVRVPILLYHYVEYVQDKKDTTRQSLNIIPYIFEQQVKTLKDAGYTFITAGDLGNILDGKGTLPEKPVILTFDDGHWDLDTDILPILKKYNVRATAYIIPGFIGGSDFLSEEQLHDVAKSGLVEIGDHTVHHVALKNQTAQTDEYEINEAKRMLENDLHIKVVSFAYPFGSFDQQAADIVKQDGLTTAVSTVPGIEVSQQNRYFLYRLRPGARTGDTLLNYLEGNSFTAFGAVKTSVTKD